MEMEAYAVLAVQHAVAVAVQWLWQCECGCGLVAFILLVGVWMHASREQPLNNPSASPCPLLLLHSIRLRCSLLHTLKTMTGGFLKGFACIQTNCPPNPFLLSPTTNFVSIPYVVL